VKISMLKFPAAKFAESIKNSECKWGPGSSKAF
jgi:hypothetical protein